MCEGASEPPLRGVVEIEWSDSGTGWGADPNLGWSMRSDPVLDSIRMRLLLESVISFLDQDTSE